MRKRERTRRSSGPTPEGSRTHDRHVLGGHAAVEQLRDLRADRLGLGKLSGRGQQRQPPVVLDRLPGLLPEAALELEQGAAAREIGVRIQMLDRNARHVPELGEQGAAGCGQHRAVLVGKSEGDVGRLPQLAHQVHLLGGEVVEPVEQDRAPRPAVRVGAQRSGSGGGEPVGVLAPQFVTELAEGPVQRRDLRLVRASLAGSLAQRDRVDARRPGARRSALPARRRSPAGAPRRPGAPDRRVMRPRWPGAVAARRSRAVGTERRGRRPRVGTVGRRCRRARRPAASPPASAPPQSARRRRVWGRPGSDRAGGLPGKRPGSRRSGPSWAGLRSASAARCDHPHLSQPSRVRGSPETAEIASNCG